MRTNCCQIIFKAQRCIIQWNWPPLPPAFCPNCGRFCDETFCITTLPPAGVTRGIPLACWVPPLQHIIQLTNHRVTTLVSNYCWQPEGTRWGLLLVCVRVHACMACVYLCVWESVCVSVRFEHQRWMDVIKTAAYNADRWWQKAGQTEDKVTGSWFQVCSGCLQT